MLYVVKCYNSIEFFNRCSIIHIRQCYSNLIHVLYQTLWECYGTYIMHIYLLRSIRKGFRYSCSRLNPCFILFIPFPISINIINHENMNLTWIFLGSESMSEIAFGFWTLVWPSWLQKIEGAICLAASQMELLDQTLAFCHFCKYFSNTKF